MGISEILFYGGIGLVVLSMIGLLTEQAVFRMKKKKLSIQLDKEYGKADD